MSEKTDLKSHGNIRNTMINEGNNCVYLSRFIKNVAIRWNKDIHSLKFTGHRLKRDFEENTNNFEIEEVSEVIIETETEQGSGNKETVLLKIEIPKEELKTIIGTEDPNKQFLTATEHPILCFKSYMQRSDGHLNNLTVGIHNTNVFLEGGQQNV